jgi:Protein of unknown function (DUF3352)
MSEHQPPSGTPEYLEHGYGGPLPPAGEPLAETTPQPRGRRRVWWVAGAVVVLAGLGAGAWAAMGFFQQGAQPAEALPSSTVAYLSLDLDPSGGQKIDAFRTLNKFPAFSDEVGVNSVDELRHKVGQELVGQADCPGLDYDRDIDPWLGDRMAVAGVPLAGEPHLVAVVQVTDEGKARTGIARLNACDDSDQDPGFAVHDGWAVLAESQKVADQVVDATAHGALADDATYQKWTKGLGDAGVVNAYASPDAGKYLGQELGGLMGSGIPGVSLATPGLRGGTSIEPFSNPSAFSGSSLHYRAEISRANPFTKALAGFQGGAATLRFTGDGVELAMAGDGRQGRLADVTGTTGGTLVQRLPDDTAAAVGVSLPKGWLDKYLDQMTKLMGGGMSPDRALSELSRQSGLDLPGDIDTLLGSGFSISVGRDLDLEELENSNDLSGLPVAATVKGDPSAIEGVLDKIRARAGGDLGFLGSDSSGDLEVVGPSADYRQQVLAGGRLGDDDTFQGVVPEAGSAGSVFYVNIDALEPAITKAAAGDRKTLDNVTPLRAVGISGWRDGDTIRFSFKVTTD